MADNKRNFRGEKSKDDIHSFFQENGDIISDLPSIANGFKNLFSGVGSQLADALPKSNQSFQGFLGEPEPDNFHFSHVHPTLIIKLCSKLKPKTSSGPDTISTKVMKVIIPFILDPFCHLLNLSFETGFILNEFKMAKVVPVFKSGERNDFNNYRPISLLSCFSKLFEKVVAHQVMKFINHRDILYTHQYGFLKKHNTIHPVMHFRGVSNIWFQNYLLGRSQFVTIKGVNSLTKNMNCGVPQGSFLGLLLFLIFINDFPS